MASASATPAASVSSSVARIGSTRARAGVSTTDTYSPLPGGENQVCPRRPRPAVCSSATTTAPSLSPVAAIDAATSLVDPTVSKNTAPCDPIRPRSVSRGRLSRASISKLMSIAGAEWVSAPTETQSAPVAASSGMRSSVTPPEISILARPFARATASRMSAVDMLSTRIVSAPAASASSTSARLSASISTGMPGRCCARALNGRR